MVDYEDTDLVIGKRYYETAKMKQIADDDFESVEFYSEDNYREAVRTAQKLSKDYDAVDIVCYTPTEDTSYHTLWFERYINGKKQFRAEV